MVKTLGTKQVPADAAIDSLEQSGYYKLLVSSVQDYAIFRLDPLGYIQTWNAGAQKLKGYKPVEIIGQHFSKFYGPEDLAADKPGRELRDCVRDGRVEDEGWRIKKDGSRFWANVVITALHDESGKLVGFAKVTRDLTERKKHEDELRHANSELKRQRHELEVLNASKDEFISLASHQLRTPATGVKQFLGLVLEGYAGEISEQQADYLRRAYESNDRQIALVNDLLRVAKLDAGKVVLEKSEVDLHALIEDVVDEQVDSFKGRRQHVAIKIPAGPISVEIDKLRFRMVLENIIDNASKYTPVEGRVTISCSVTDTEVAIAVRDSGVGLRKDQLPKLFKKFSRVRNELSNDVGGSGLGLYWAHKIVGLHGGEITVDSTPGKGSTFVVHLPKGGRRG